MHRLISRARVFRNPISRFVRRNFVRKRAQIDLHNRCINSSPRRINFVSIESIVALVPISSD